MDVTKRSDKVAFYGVPTGEGEYTFYRMKGFSDLSTSKNAKEYTRQYVDEEFEQTDVVGYSPSISFTLDQMKNDPVHKDIADIYNNEKVGVDAVRPIVIVDMLSDAKEAISRDYAVIADGEGNGMDAYVYSGTLKAKGEKIKGTATSADEWKTITFVAGDETSE